MNLFIYVFTSARVIYVFTSARGTEPSANGLASRVLRLDRGTPESDRRLPLEVRRSVNRERRLSAVRSVR